jgi:hypothetical protein
MTIGWKQLYRLALLEGDPAQVLTRIAHAHAAIEHRMEELATPSSSEHLAMKDALRFLRLLQNETSAVPSAISVVRTQSASVS